MSDDDVTPKFNRRAGDQTSSDRLARIEQHMEHGNDVMTQLDKTCAMIQQEQKGHHIRIVSLEQDRSKVVWIIIGAVLVAVLGLVVGAKAIWPAPQPIEVRINLDEHSRSSQQGATP